MDKTENVKKCYYSIICKKKQSKFHLIDKVHACWPGTQKVFVSVKLTLEETGKLIEWAEKNAEEDIGEMKSVSIVDVPG